MRIPAPFALLCASLAMLLAGCTGEAPTATKGVDEIKTREALEALLAESGAELLEESEFAAATLTTSGRRFEYRVPYTDADTTKQVTAYYSSTFAAALEDGGWSRSPMSTPLRLVFTKAGRTLSITVPPASTAATTGSQPVYFTCSVK